MRDGSWVGKIVFGLLIWILAGTLSAWAATPNTPLAPAQPRVALGEKPQIVLDVWWDAPSDRGSSITGYTLQSQLTFSPDSTPDPGWWFYNNAYVLSWWGSGQYAEVHNGAGRWEDISSATTFTPNVWLSDRTETGPPFDSLREAKLWAEFLIANPKTCGVYEPPTYKGAACSWIYLYYTGPEDLDYTLVQLPQDRWIKVRVRAVNEVGDSEWSPYSSPFLLVPRPPDTPTLDVTPGLQQLEMSWPVPSPNGAYITGYTVQWQAIPSPESLDGTPDPGWWFYNNAYVLSWWGSGQYAEVHNGAGRWEDISSATTFTPTVWLSDRTVTGPPFDSLREAQLWAESVIDNRDDGGNVTISTDDRCWNCPPVTYTLTDLMSPSGHYQVRVRASNPAGEGPWSQPMSIQTLGIPDAPYIHDVLGADIPWNSYQYSFTPQWGVPASNGATITHYVMQLRPANTDDWSHATEQIEDSFYTPINGYKVGQTLIGIDSFLVNPQQDYPLEWGLKGYQMPYLIRVRAVTAVGHSPWSNVYTAYSGQTYFGGAGD